MRAIRLTMAGITAAVVAVDLVLVLTGRLSGGVALALLLAIEAALLAFFFLVSWRESRVRGVPLVQLVPPLALIIKEIHAWSDLFRLFRGRHYVPQGCTPLPARTGLWQLPIMLTVAVLIEVVVVELLVPWLWLRLPLLVISLYSLGLMWGMLAARAIYPHYIDHEGSRLVLRRGRMTVLHVPLEALARISHERSYDSIEHQVENEQLTLGGNSGTTTRLDLNQPLPAVLDRWPWQPRNTAEVTRINFFVDEPDSAVALLKMLTDRKSSSATGQEVRNDSVSSLPPEPPR